MPTNDDFDMGGLSSGPIRADHDQYGVPDHGQQADEHRRAQSGNRRASTHKLFNMASQRTANMTLSPDGEAFRTKLVEALTAVGCEVKAVIGRPGYVIHDTQNLKSIVLYFSESYPEIQQQGNGAAAQALLAAFGKDDRIGGGLICELMVTPPDYTRVEQWIKFIRESLKRVEDNTIADLTLELMREAAGSMQVDYSPHVAEQFLQAHSVNSVLPVIDLAVTLQVYQQEENGSYRYDYKDRPDESQVVTMATAVGYVSFEKVNSYQMYNGVPRQWRPLIHISEIYSVFPTVRMFGPMLTLFAEYVLGGDGLNWVKPFLTNRDGRNLGNMIMDPETGAPIEFKDASQVIRFVQEACLEPVLVLDVATSRPTLAGLGNLAYSQGQKSVIEEIEVFFGRRLNINRIIEDPMLQVVNGIVQDKTGIQDARVWDFFRLFAESGNLDNSAWALEVLNVTDPRFRMKKLDEIGFKPICTNELIIGRVNPDLLQSLIPMIEDLDITKVQSEDARPMLFGGDGRSYTDMFRGSRITHSRGGSYYGARNVRGVADRWGY